jgi:D-alanyl-D-alanine carboxypeptidase (penicillin-binding protein 5/6)
MMNRKAVALGLYQTNYLNTNGLPAAGHYSSAFDLAILARYALHDQVFAELVKTKYAIVKQASPPRQKTVKNTNRLLWQYSGATG